MRAVYTLLKDAGVAFWKDKGPRLGAAIAFYTALSLAPLLVVAVAIAGFALRDEARAGGLLDTQISELVGEDGAKAVQTMLAAQTLSGGTVAVVIGVLTLIVGSTGLFAQLQDALDTIWHAEAPPTGGLGIGQLVKDRLLSFSLVCGVAFLLLVSLLASTALSAVGGYVNSWFPFAEAWLKAGNLVVSLLVTGLMFALIFKVLPHARPRWSDVWVGAAVTAGLFAVGKYLIGLYLGKAAVGSAYGAAGSFVALLVWVYWSAQILLFGAAVTRVYAMRHGHKPGGQPAADPAKPDAQTVASGTQPALA